MDPRPGSLATVRAAIVSCERCPRLRQYCQQIGREKRRAYRNDTYWARPVAGFGDPEARLLILDWRRPRTAPTGPDASSRATASAGLATS